MKKLLKTTILLAVIALAITAQSLTKDQAIAGADKDCPATFFNRALVIELVSIDDGYEVF